MGEPRRKRTDMTNGVEKTKQNSRVKEIKIKEERKGGR